MSGDSLTWVHFGDLHLTEANEPNHRDLVRLIDEANAHLAGAVDFCFLPGDNADNGAPQQYQLLRSAIDRLRIPLHVIPGDHDRESGSLAPFYSGLGVDTLPKAISLQGYRCLFLDIVSAGRGGPDFRLSQADLLWLEEQMTSGREAGERSVLFMHTYPADLKEGAAQLLALMRRHRVPAVDMGHSHYNELSNDGHTIYATTRSTGQVEEGPVGFSIMSLQGAEVSWRFKPLASAWPLVMITSPADARLKTAISSPNGPGPSVVSARAWSNAGIRECRCRFDDEPWQRMEPTADGLRWDLYHNRADKARLLTVQAEDRLGNIDCDSIRLQPQRATRVAGDGSDADAVGSWPEKHIFGTQLGPNRNGRKW